MEDLISIFNEQIMIDGKEVDYKPPEESELIDLGILCPWLARQSETAATHPAASRRGIRGVAA